MRRILIGVGIAIAVVIAGLFIALRDVNKFRPQIQAQIEKHIHRNVALGDMSLKIFPFAVHIESLSISEDPAFGSAHPFVTASDVSASAGLFSLIRGTPEVKSIRLNHPQIELIRNAAGQWNFQSLARGQNTSSSESDLNLNSLEIDDGQVAYTDAVQKTSRTIYDHIGMKLSDFAPNKPFGLDLNVHFPGSGKQLLSLKSKIGPLPQEGSVAATPIDGKVSLEEVTLSGFSKFAASALPPNTDGTVSGDTTLKTQNEQLSATGNLKLVDITVKGSKLDYPIEAKFDLTDNRKTDQLNIKSSELKLGSTPFSLSGDIDSAKTPVILNVKLGTQNASITDLAKLAGSFGYAFNPAYQVKGQLTANIAAKGPSSAPQLSGKITGRDVAISGGEVKQPVQVSSLDLALSPQAIVSSPFTAQSGSTRVDAVFTVSNYTSSNNMLIDASLKTGNADIAELVNMAKAYGVDASKAMTATGKLSLNVHVQGPVAQSAKLMYAGSGTISGATLNAPAALTKPVSISSADLNFAQNSASVSNLAMSIGSTAVRGNLSAKNLAAPQVSFQLAAEKINTADLEQLTAVPKSHSSTLAATPKASEPSMLSKITGGGTLSVGTVIANDFTLTNVKTSVKLNNGVVALSPLTANLYGGQESGSVTLDTRPAKTLCAVNAKLSGVDANSLLAAVSSAKDTLYGSLTATSNVNFILLSSNELPKTLNGTINFNVANGELKHVNVLNEVSQIAKFLNPGQARSSGNSTKLSKLSGSMNIVNGEATTNDLVAAISGGSLSGKGSVNLASQALNMNVNAVLASGLTQSVGGTGVGGFLSTALANNKGEMVVPVKVGGTLQKPVFTPDASAMAQMKLKNLLPTTGNPAAGIAGAIGSGKAGGLNGILSGLTGSGQQPAQQGQQQQQQPKAADTVKDILKGFGKKKQ